MNFYQQDNARKKKEFDAAIAQSKLDREAGYKAGQDYARIYAPSNWQAIGSEIAESMGLDPQTDEYSAAWVDGYNNYRNGE